MNNLREPLERLRSANPVPWTDSALPPPDPLLFRRITTEEIAGDAGARLRPDRRGRRRRLVPVLVVSSLLVGAAAYGLLRGDVSKPINVACFELADLGAATEVASVDERGPVEACAELWRRGVFGDVARVPDLAVCVLDSGVAGVFPTTSGQAVCTQLNLPPAQASAPPTTASPAASVPPSDATARILAFRDAVAGPFVESPCMDPRDGAALVRRELDRAGLNDWTIRGGDGQAGGGFSAQRPCATLSVRPDTKEVVLVPAPRR